VLSLRKDEDEDGDGEDKDEWLELSEFVSGLSVEFDEVVAPKSEAVGYGDDEREEEGDSLRLRLCCACFISF